MNILVTGGHGLVGYAIQQIAKETKDKFIFLSSKDCDLSDYQETERYFSSLKEKPHAVIHLAANVGGLYKNINQKVEMFEKNVAINMNVLQISHKFGVKKVVSILSTCIFPDNTTYPINESMLHAGPPHDSNYAYAYAKRMLEIQSRAYYEEHGKKFICVIPTNIYGENDNYSLQDGHVIPSLIHKCYLAKRDKTKFIVCGTGKPVRQFIYAPDLAAMIMKILLQYDEKEPIILSTNPEDEIAIADVGYLIADAFEYKDHLVFDDSYVDGQYKKTADNAKYVGLYGAPEFTKIKEGISKSVKWFIENYERLNANRKAV